MYKPKLQSGSRSQMLQWINRTLNINETKIQNLGNGVIYTLLINHFYPNTIPSSKMISNPRSPHDFRLNLRRLQQAATTLDLKGISFDVFKVSQMTYAQNWNLISKLYKCLQNVTEREKSTDMARWQTRNTQNKTQMSFIKNNPNQIFPHPMLTPMKSKNNDEGGKMRWQTIHLIQQIKKIVSNQGAADRAKVGQLRKLLDLQQGGQESETDLKDLLSDYKKNHQVIQLD